MTAPAVQNAIFSRCRAIHGPSGFTSSPSYGGTRLGMLNMVVARIFSKRFEVTAEEYHGTVVEIIEGQAQRIIVGAELREYDTDALSAVAGSSNPLALTYTTRRGVLGSSRAVAFLLAPIDPYMPGVYIPRAVPMLNMDAAMKHATRDAWTVPIVWQALPDSSGRLIQMGPIAGFTL